MDSHQLERVEEDREPVQDIHDRPQGRRRVSPFESLREMLAQFRSHLEHVELKLGTLDDALLDKSAILEELHNYRVALATSNETNAMIHGAFIRERQKFTECNQAYGSLHDQHSMTVSEVQSLTHANLLLKEELQQAKELIPTSDGETVELSDRPITEHGAARIAELEMEKASVEREYQQALVNAANRICLLQAKLDKFQDSTYLPELQELGFVAIEAEPHPTADTQGICDNISLDVEQEVLGVETTQKEPKRRRVKGRNPKLRLLKAKSPMAVEN